MAHDVEGGDILLMKTRDGVIEFKPEESLSNRDLDVSYAIDPKDETELLKKGKKPRDLSGNPLEVGPKEAPEKGKKGSEHET
jgi:hypothetical protein